MDRGECSFTDKTQRAVEAGAVGVIVVNSDDNLIEMTSDIPIANVNISVVMVSKSGGNILKGTNISLSTRLN